MNKPECEKDLQRRIDELHERVAVNRADIDKLAAHALAAHDRADDMHVRADANHHRMDKIEAAIAVDRDMIVELQADGVVSQEHAAQLEEALRSARSIGAAMGIVMANREVNEEEAFEILKKASQRCNRKVRELAVDIVRTGGVSDLPRD